MWQGQGQKENIIEKINKYKLVCCEPSDPAQLAQVLTDYKAVSILVLTLHLSSLFSFLSSIILLRHVTGEEVQCFWEWRVGR